MAPSGAETTLWFCLDCTGGLYGSRLSRPDSVIGAGSLDDTSWLRPAPHFYVSSAQPWINLPEADCFEDAPADFAALAKPSRARSPL